MASMITVVTGASGHVGACLSRSLIEEGRTVRVLLHRDQRALEDLPAERVKADLQDRRSLVEAFAGAEVVYHLAAAISMDRRKLDRMMRINVDGTSNVIAACRAAGVRRLVHFSSIEALSDRGRASTTVESNPLAQQEETTAYGWSKACAETLVLEAAAQGLEAVILNPTAIVGPYDFRPSHLGKVLISLSEGRMPVLVEGGFNWVDVRDVARAAMAAEERGRSGERYLVAGTWLSLPQLARLVDAACGRRTFRLAVPCGVAGLGAGIMDSFAYRDGREPVFTLDTLLALSKHRHISIDKASRELGHAPRPLEETVPHTLAWFAEQGYLKPAAASEYGTA
ncbi:MAG: NAD-dependent epimerase/dehydratase family protein [Spirochaetales bacterium]|nr:NAD-dependent epimerase/dehydratase family protein [Spirochaetales bacterium]